MGRNLKNAVIAFLTPLPSILFYLHFLNHYSDVHDDANALSVLWKWCLDHPLLLANALFFLNVNVVFWIISHFISSHWMIDLYWTVIPVLLLYYYAAHPLAHYDLWRSRIVTVLTWVWSIRLTHNYFRREKWQWGAREDWRFTDMSTQYGKHWWWASFFAVYASQQVDSTFSLLTLAPVRGWSQLTVRRNVSMSMQVFLIGVCLPIYIAHSIDKALDIWDFVAVVVCVSGIVIAYYADTQLHEFVTQNEKLKELGQPVVVNLEKGLWYYSRHPNYFGEQLWWWGLGIFAWNLGHGWAFIGALVNSMCLAYVTVLVERRMLKQESRAEAYRLYQKTTSVWVPLFKSKVKEI